MKGIKMKDVIKNIRGFVNILHYDENKNLIQEYNFENLVVTTGQQWVASRLNDPVTPVMNWIAVGTNNAVPALNQTTLSTELFRDVVSVLGGAVSGSSIVYNQTILPGDATGALVEAGIFNQAAAGTMLSRVTFPVINKSAADTVAITWTITVG
jgi:hypothetical protein